MFCGVLRVKEEGTEQQTAQAKHLCREISSLVGVIGLIASDVEEWGIQPEIARPHRNRLNQHPGRERDPPTVIRVELIQLRV